jgi:hypothetical protein
MANDKITFLIFFLHRKTNGKSKPHAENNFILQTIASYLNRTIEYPKQGECQ